MIDVAVRLISFPSGKVHEAVTENEDGTFTVFLDKNMTQEYQQKRFLHAIRHLNGKDFEKENVQEIEAEAHGRTYI